MHRRSWSVLSGDGVRARCKPHDAISLLSADSPSYLSNSLEVSASINDDEGFQYNLSTLKIFFGNPHVLALWVTPFAIAVLFRIMTMKLKHQLVFPMCKFVDSASFKYVVGLIEYLWTTSDFMAIPCVFYIVKAILHVDLDTLRTSGWVFDVGRDSAPWYEFYTYFSEST